MVLKAAWNVLKKYSQMSFFFSDGISGAYEWPIKQAWAPPENKHRKSAEW